MVERSLISIPPRVAAVLDALISVLMIFWFDRINSLLLLGVWFAAHILWYGVLLYTMYYPSFMTRVEHLQALIIFNLGIVFLILFVDEPMARYVLEAVLLFFSAGSFWLVPGNAHDLSVMAKPYRRWKFLMSIFGVAGVWNGVKALEIFQVTSGFLTVSLVTIAVILTVLISVWGWQEYGLMYSKKFLIASATLTLCLAEAAYVIYLWPLGYFVSSFIITWVWYVLWLFLRFFISDEGITMKRQRWFLLWNIAMLIIFLVFIVRWK